MEMLPQQARLISGVDIGGEARVIFGDHITTTQLAPARPETPPIPSSTIIPRRDANFIDREDLLDDIGKKTSTPGAWIALVGLGGIGKTQLAIRYVHGQRENNANVWILWIFAGNVARFDESIRDVADQIRLPGRQNHQANLLNLLQIWLANSSRQWVIVLDNVDDAGFLLESPPAVVDDLPSTKPRIEYFPTCANGTVVVTSRYTNEARKIVDEDNIVAVQTLDVKHAAALIQKKLGSKVGDRSAEDFDELARLAEALDSIPLALSQAASFIRQKRRYTISRYLQELERSQEARTKLLRQEAMAPRRDRHASNSILLTWQISFEYIRRTRESAIKLLALMSFCDRRAIPELLLRDIGQSQQQATDAKDMAEDSHDVKVCFDEDIQTLEDFSFVSAGSEPSSWDMHRLIQDATQAWLIDHGFAESSRLMYLQRLYTVFPPLPFKDMLICKILMPHVKPSWPNGMNGHDTSLLWAAIMFRTSVYCRLQSLRAKAEHMAKQCMEIFTTTQGAGHKNTLNAMNLLALCYMEQGRREEARTLQEATLKSARENYAAEEQIVLACMTNLAEMYARMNRWEEALQLHKDSHMVQRELLEPRHPDVLYSRQRLAVLYQATGKWNEAEELQIEMLNTMREVLGEEDMQTLGAMRELADTYILLGKAEKSEKLQVEAIEGFQKGLSADAHLMISLKIGLASSYLLQKRFQEAEELLDMTARVCRETLGADHPTEMARLHIVANVYVGQGRSDLAEDILKPLLEKQERIAGADSAATLSCMQSLAQVQIVSGKVEQAEELSERLAEVRRERLGTNHPRTLESEFWLALLRYKQGRLDEALKLMRKCSRSFIEVWGSGHPYTMDVMNMVAFLEEHLRVNSVNGPSNNTEDRDPSTETARPA